MSPRRGAVLPRAVDAVYGVAYAAVLTLLVLQQTPLLTDAVGRSRTAVVALLLLLLVALDRWEHARWGVAAGRSAVLLLLARAVLVETTVQVSGNGFGLMLYVVLPLSAALAFGSWAGAGVGLAVLAVFVGKLSIHKPQWIEDPATLVNVGLFLVTVVLVVALARTVHSETAARSAAERLVDDLRASHRAVSGYAREVEELATANERNRLAREIHDSLGHYLTVINVQLEKALAYRARDGTEADSAVTAAKDLASAALADVRRSVGALRSHEPFVLESALELLAGPLRGPHRTIEVLVSGEEARVSRRALLSVFRAAQEALTNMERHSRARHVRVRVDICGGTGQDTVRLRVSDDGVGFPPGLLEGLPAPRRHRLGLSGLAERAELEGGRCTVDSSPGVGTTVVFELPAYARPAPSAAAARVPVEVPS
ncbi:MAG: sensor histidine kinase [Kineosporiaceae bacterium]